MATIELIYDLDCPNINFARSQLMKAFSQTGITANWTEWDRSSTDSPPHAHQFGSPTILINRQDVTGQQPSEQSECCRLYRDSQGNIQGAPTVEVISAALTRSEIQSSASQGISSDDKTGWQSSLAVIPGIAFAMLPKLACPACWPAYAGLLSSLGLGFLVQTKYMLPMTILFLFVAVGALFIHARSRKSYGPVFVGIVAAIIVLSGKFQFDSDAAMYGGIGLLVAASVWNAWPRRKDLGCPACGDIPLTPLTLEKEIS